MSVVPTATVDFLETMRGNRPIQDQSWYCVSMGGGSVSVVLVWKVSGYEWVSFNTDTYRHGCTT